MVCSSKAGCGASLARIGVFTLESPFYPLEGLEGLKRECKNEMKVTPQGPFIPISP